MGMQLLYGNDGKNYRTIARSKEMTDEQERVLLSRYLGYEFAENVEPVALSYVTTDLDGTLPEEMILLSRQVRIAGCRAPSYYAHFHLLESQEAWYGEKFFDLLRFSFIKDAELAAYQSGEIQYFAQKKEDGSSPIRRDAVLAKLLIPVVAAVLETADQMSGRVCLALDACGKDYNRRALEVIAAVYACIPYGLRRKISFSTYAGTDPARPAVRAKVQIYPREALRKAESGVIDLAQARDDRCSSSLQLLRVSDRSFHFAKELAEKQEMERQALFVSFQCAFGLLTASVEDYIFYYRHMEEWQKGSLEEMKDDLARYAYKGMQQEKKPLMFQVFCRIFSERFEEEKYDRRYEQMLEEMLWAQKGFAFDNKMKAYLMLGEALDCLQLDVEMFLEWEHKAVLEAAAGEYEGEELISFLAGQRKNLHLLPVRGRKFREVAVAMEREMKRYLNEIERILPVEGRGCKNEK